MPTPHFAPGEDIGRQQIEHITLLRHPGSPSALALYKHKVLQKMDTDVPCTELEFEVSALLGWAGVLLPFTSVQHLAFTPRRCWTVVAQVESLRTVRVPQVATGCWPGSIGPNDKEKQWYRNRHDGSIDYYRGEHQVWNAPPNYWERRRTPV